MGLAIHYSFKSVLANLDDVRTLVETTRQVASGLEFQRISELIELHGDEADFQNSSVDDPLRWLKVRACEHIADPNGQVVAIQPTDIFAFTTEPGADCAPASFGLCRYPRGYCPGSRSRTGKRQLPTYLKDWRWRSGCKTQRASGGGMANFLHCHLRLIGLLDFVRDTGLVNLQVSDDGGYWVNRDVAKLAQAVIEWNEALHGSTAISRAEIELAIQSANNALATFAEVKRKGHERLRSLRHKGPRKDP